MVHQLVGMLQQVLPVDQPLQQVLVLLLTLLLLLLHRMLTRTVAVGGEVGCELPGRRLPPLPPTSTHCCCLTSFKLGLWLCGCSRKKAQVSGWMLEKIRSSFPNLYSKKIFYLQWKTWSPSKHWHRWKPGQRLSRQLTLAARVDDPLDLQRLRRLKEALQPILWHRHCAMVHVRHQGLKYLR